MHVLLIHTVKYIYIYRKKYNTYFVYSLILIKIYSSHIRLDPYYNTCANPAPLRLRLHILKGS